MDSYDVRFWDIKRIGNGSTARFRFRWAVDGREHCKSFKARPLADGFLTDLKDAVRDGRPFNPRTGLPEAEVTEDEVITWYQHSRAYTEAKWPNLAPVSRRSVAEALVTVTIALASKEPGAGRLRQDASREASGRVDPAAQAVGVLQRPRLRRRTRAPRLEPGRPDQWTAPAPAVAQSVDRRVVVSPAQAEALLGGVGRQGQRGAHLKAFFACLYYAALRPSEGVMLREADLHLPKTGWGRIVLRPRRPGPGGPGPTRAPHARNAA